MLFIIISKKEVESAAVKIREILEDRCIINY